MCWCAVKKLLTHTHPAHPLKIILYVVADFVPCTRSAAVFNSLHVDVPVVNRREVHGMWVLVVSSPLRTGRCNLSTVTERLVHLPKYFKMPQDIPVSFLWVLKFIVEDQMLLVVQKLLMQTALPWNVADQLHVRTVQLFPVVERKAEKRRLHGWLTKFCWFI